jgi:hypothetical protein
MIFGVVFILILEKIVKQKLVKNSVIKNYLKMVRNKVCAVRNCLETDEMYKFRSFYKIPTSEIRKSQWLKAIPYLSEKSLICDRHFSRNNFGSQGK